MNKLKSKIDILGNEAIDLLQKENGPRDGGRRRQRRGRK